MRTFSLFLIIALVFAGLLASYIMLGGQFNSNSSWKTGTILDKFNNQERGDSNQEENNDEIKPFLLVDRKVNSINNSSEKGGVVYFEKNTGKIFTYNLETGTEEISLNDSSPNLLSVLWSPKKGEAIGHFYSPSGDRFKYYNLNTFETSDLDSSIQSVAFSPDGNLVVYYHLLKSEDGLSIGKIFISQPNGQYSKKIFQTRLEKLSLHWPIQEFIALKTPVGLFLLTEDGKLSKLLELNYDSDEKWSPSGKKLLVSSFDSIDNPEIVLRVVNAESKTEQPLGFNISASKCVWSIDDTNIFCALPESPSSDSVYLINTSDGSSKLIADLGMSVKEFLLSTTENYILFTNTADERPYGIKLTLQ